MFGAEKRDQLHAGRVEQNIDRAYALRIDSGGVGDEPDALAFELGELVLLEHVDPELDVRGLEQRCGTKQPAEEKDRAG